MTESTHVDAASLRSLFIPTPPLYSVCAAAVSHFTACANPFFLLRPLLLSCRMLCHLCTFTSVYVCVCVCVEGSCCSMIPIELSLTAVNATLHCSTLPYLLTYLSMSCRHGRRHRHRHRHQTFFHSLCFLIHVTHSFLFQSYCCMWIILYDCAAMCRCVIASHRITCSRMYFIFLCFCPAYYVHLHGSCSSTVIAAAVVHRCDRSTLAMDGTLSIVFDDHFLSSLSVCCAVLTFSLSLCASVCLCVFFAFLFFRPLVFCAFFVSLPNITFTVLLLFLLLSFPHAVYMCASGLRLYHCTTCHSAALCVVFFASLFSLLSLQRPRTLSLSHQSTVGSVSSRCFYACHRH